MSTDPKSEAADREDNNPIAPLTDELPAIPETLKPLMRLYALLETPEAVAQQPSVALHRVIRDVGLDEAAELVSLAQPEQIRELVDLQAWSGERIDADELLSWTHMLAQIAEGGRAEHLRALDVELVGFLIRRNARIYLLEPEFEPPEPEGYFFKTPDGWFLLDIVCESQDGVDQIVSVIDALYRDDLDHVRRLLQSLMWEVPAELEEWSLRWRRGRLADLGFADAEQAQTVYAYLPPASVRLDEGTADLGIRADPQPAPAGRAVDLIPPLRGSFWADAMARIADPRQRQRIGRALLSLANRCMSADHVDPGDTDGATQSLRLLHGRLGLALQHVCGDDPRLATEALANISIGRLARLGHSLIVDQQRRLNALAAGALGRRGSHSGQPFELLRDEPLFVDRADGNTDEFSNSLSQQLLGICARRPYRIDAKGDAEPIMNTAQLATLTTAVDRVLLIDELVPIALRPPESDDPLTLRGIFASRVINQKQGADPAAPLDGDALAAARQWATAASDNFVEAFLVAQPTRATAICRRWALTTKAELASLPKTPDPRFVDCLYTV